MESVKLINYLLLKLQVRKSWDAERGKQLSVDQPQRESTIHGKWHGEAAHRYPCPTYYSHGRHHYELCICMQFLGQRLPVKELYFYD